MERDPLAELTALLTGSGGGMGTELAIAAGVWAMLGVATGLLAHSRGRDGTVNLMAAGERLSPIAFVQRPLLLPAIPPWLRCEIGEASGEKSGGAGR